VCEQGISLSVFQLGYVVDEASMDHREVEEFFVFFSFFEPLNSGFMSLENFFLFEAFFQLLPGSLLFMLLSWGVPGLNSLHL
jgi:hypothetical protein